MYSSSSPSSSAAAASDNTIRLLLQALVQGEAHYWNRIGLERTETHPTEHNAFVSRCMAVFATLTDFLDDKRMEMNAVELGAAVDVISRRMKAFYAAGDFKAEFPEPFALIREALRKM